MGSDTSRSEQVVEDYKKRKLAISAMRRIHDLIHSFEKDRAADLRLARIGIVLLLAVLAVAAFYFFNTDSVTLS